MRNKFKILFVILMVVSATTGCDKDEEIIVSVTEASWYFGTWIEDGSDNILHVSESSLMFSSSSDLQYYGSSSPTWYNAGDESADLFFGYNTAGGSFQGTDGINSIPNRYLINHNGELLSIRMFDYSTQSETEVKTYTRDEDGVTGNWERSDGASYLKFSGSSIYLCNGSTLQEFSGTYDASSNEATLVEGSTTLTFIIYPEGSDKILIEQWVSNEHLGSQYYYKTTEYPCN